MKKIVIIGGSGTIGKVLVEHLQSKYKLYVADQELGKNQVNFIKIDATNQKDLHTKIPKDTDILVNLLATDNHRSLDDIEAFDRMTNIYLRSSYLLYDLAVSLKIPKVIVASSNHVTDEYEKDGHSLLGREITVNDYPYSRGLYGVLKLATENLGRIYSKEKGLSVLLLRIGSVPSPEKKQSDQERWKHTLLTEKDTAQLFEKAFEVNKPFGIYYGVSNHPSKPWSIKNAEEDLGFKSELNP
ncbi:NAD-dependent epimerase/dehydratase family protein [Alkalihalobacillus trypoxylicola]|uniref:NAD-dependent epimerase/dehydratase domain-containing protein n=1 Tax=Alkalihalobacillus trypoxylicola TaxID=519424 RepID=A0A162CXA9_9BACI|nr:NAD(P)-dependent oxidoreductase [Alkalihalobacillus trypoxylicola]KYG27013.1 hypothetical protein AZF04_11805 [Alkalihalobacillus trypoxylicola]